METKEMITQKMKIYDIVKKYPQLLEVLIRQSPKFTKLKNKVMFNTMARLASIQDAAKMGDLPLEDLLLVLNQTIGKEAEYRNYINNEKTNEEEIKQEKNLEEAQFQYDHRDMFANKEEFPVVDVRDLGDDAFQTIMNVVKQTSIGEGFCIIQSFEPLPLYKVLGNKGFEHETHKKFEEEYWVYFVKVKDLNEKRGFEK